MKLLRPPQSASALLTMIAVLFAALLALGWSTYLELGRQRESPTDSSQWSIFQASLEFNRLNNAFAQFRVEDNEESRNEFKKRFDIFYSRVGILNSSNAFAEFRSKSYYVQATRILSDFTQQIAGLIDRNEFDRLRKDPQVISDFEVVGRSVTTFVASAVQTQAIWDVTARNHLERLLLAQLVTTGLVLLSFLYFAFVVLQQRNKAITREAEIRSREDLLRATVNSSLDGVLIADAKGVIVEINDAAAEMFGFAASAMEGREMSGLIIPQRLRAAHQEGMARYGATGKAKVIGRRIEIDAMRQDGSEFPIELSISATGTGNAAKYVAFMRDITDRRIQERSLQSAKERAEDASRAKAQFLASISHEMRTPLTGILGALDLISETDLSEVQTKYVETANRSGHALLSVISDVLDISRLEAGKIELNLETLDINGIINDVLEIIGKLATDRGNAIQLDVDEAIPPLVNGDPARIRQVLLNLVTNAVKFTYEGSITVSLTCLANDGQIAEVEFAVRDTGQGISQVDKTKLFQSFSQLRSNVEHPLGGSGLGLAISSRLVEMMGGSIGVDSEVGKGSRFWFRLPLPISSQRSQPDDGTSAKDPQTPTLTPMAVLVIDDNETVRSIIAGLLASRGHSAETADGALKGLSMLLSSRFDAVILDISMPGMDGFEALRAIRKLPGTAGRTPVIALTAHALIEDRERCLAAGFDQFLTKPVRAEELARAIASATSAEAAESRVLLQPDEAEDTTPLFDLEELRQQFVSVSPSDLHRIVDRFGTELDQQLEFLKGDGNDMSPYHLRRIVHVLSGSASMIGAKRLAALAGQLDAHATGSEGIGVQTSVDELVALIVQTRKAVETAKLSLQAEGS
jgi:PAS domain S-box-containing protein